MKIAMRIRRDSVEDFLRFAPDTWEISYVTTNGEIVIAVGENRVTFAGDGVLEIARMTWADTVEYERVYDARSNWGGNTDRRNLSACVWRILIGNCPDALKNTHNVKNSKVINFEWRKIR